MECRLQTPRDIVLCSSSTISVSPVLSPREISWRSSYSVSIPSPVQTPRNVSVVRSVLLPGPIGSARPHYQQHRQGPVCTSPLLDATTVLAPRKGVTPVRAPISRSRAPCARALKIPGWERVTKDKLVQAAPPLPPLSARRGSISQSIGARSMEDTPRQSTSSNLAASTCPVEYQSSPAWTARDVHASCIAEFHASPVGETCAFRWADSSAEPFRLAASDTPTTRSPASSRTATPPTPRVTPCTSTPQETPRATLPECRWKVADVIDECSLEGFCSK